MDIGLCMAVRLLRARGDRPLATLTAERLQRPMVAAPRTRRSTPILIMDGGGLRGCSAHAEIDLDRKAHPHGNGGLLRARGDRPFADQLPVIVDVAAPRTRRSTPGIAVGRRHERGCSAHAEIDPSCRATSAAPSGLLRARGDRPYTVAGITNLLTAAPRTRRSTSTHPREVSMRAGCSAHAEIDP